MVLEDDLTVFSAIRRGLFVSSSRAADAITALRHLEGTHRRNKDDPFERGGGAHQELRQAADLYFNVGSVLTPSNIDTRAPPTLTNLFRRS